MLLGSLWEWDKSYRGDSGDQENSVSHCCNCNIFIVLIALTEVQSCTSECPIDGIEENPCNLYVYSSKLWWETNTQWRSSPTQFLSTCRKSILGETRVKELPEYNLL
ncbi:hypothetical protein DMENIID0001_121960 [Sergentomyia squamirostris]